MPKRKTLTLTDRAADLLPQFAGFRDQGAYVSQLIEAIADAAVEQDTLARLENGDLDTIRQILREVVIDVTALKVRLAQKKP